MIALLAAVFWRRLLPHSPRSIVVAITPSITIVDPALNNFCRSLTGNVIQQLAASGKDHYCVIGNAAELFVATVGAHNVTCTGAPHLDSEMWVGNIE